MHPRSLHACMHYPVNNLRCADRNRIMHQLNLASLHLQVYVGELGFPFIIEYIYVHYTSADRHVCPQPHTPDRMVQQYY